MDKRAKKRVMHENAVNQHNQNEDSGSSVFGLFFFAVVIFVVGFAIYSRFQ